MTKSTIDRVPEDVTRPCLFCTAPLTGARAREHVLPQWLLDEIGIRREPITPTQFRPSMDVVSTRSHLLENLQEGRVCAACNNGWMSELETAAIPVLKPLMHGTSKVTDLTRTQCALVARWTVKTAYMLNTASNYDLKIPAGHLSELHTNVHPVPKGVAVFAQQHKSDRDFYWLQGAMWHGVFGNEVVDFDPQEATTRSYKIALQFRSLILLVACWPFEGWRLALWRGVHRPLWPQEGPIASYESDLPFPCEDSTKSVVAFHGALMLAQVRPP
jgi:hypothetical protein